MRIYVDIDSRLVLEYGLDVAYIEGLCRYALPSRGYAELSVEDVQEFSGLSKFKQDKAIEILEELGRIKVENKGWPIRRFISYIGEFR